MLSNGDRGLADPLTSPFSERNSAPLSDVLMSQTRQRGDARSDNMIAYHVHLSHEKDSCFAECGHFRCCVTGAVPVRCVNHRDLIYIEMACI